MDRNWQPVTPDDDGVTNLGPDLSPPAEPSHTTRSRPSGRLRRLKASGTIVGALLVGGAAGSILLAPALTAAQTPSTAPSSTSTTGNPPFHMGGHNEAVTDTSVAAKAIGISEADLVAALQGGQTIAAVAKAHNVAVQTVIDALVADSQAEFAAAVKAGTLTQAQADAEKAEVLQRVTEQVNGTFHPMDVRGPGMGGPGMDGWH